MKLNDDLILTTKNKTVGEETAPEDIEQSRRKRSLRQNILRFIFKLFHSTFLNQSIQGPLFLFFFFGSSS